MLVRDPLVPTVVHPPAPPMALLSRTGRLALRAAGDEAQAAGLDPSVASLLQRTAQQGDSVRALLDQLAQDLAAGNVAAAAAHLHRVLEPVRLIDGAQARFADARQEAQAALSAAQGGWQGEAMAGGHLPDPVALRQVHAAASGAAAALDDLALCAQALAEALEQTLGT